MQALIFYSITIISSPDESEEPDDPDELSDVPDDQVVSSEITISKSASPVLVPLPEDDVSLLPAEDVLLSEEAELLLPEEVDSFPSIIMIFSSSSELPEPEELPEAEVLFAT